jgi:hypothetical protein
MFKLCRDQCLENANWYGTKDNKLEYIEAWKYSDIDRSNDEISGMATWMTTKSSIGLATM